MEDELAGGPAFPYTTQDMGSTNGVVAGISMRDYFASKVDLRPYGVLDSLESQIGHRATIGEVADYIAKIRYLEADAMLAEREKP